MVGDGADGDEVPGAAPHEVWDQGTRYEKGGHQIHGDRAGELVGRCLRNRLNEEDARVIHDDVRDPPVGEDVADGALHGRGVGHVTAQVHPTVGRAVDEGTGEPHDVRPRAVQQLGHGESDAARGARDECELPGKGGGRRVAHPGPRLYTSRRNSSRVFASWSSAPHHHAEVVRLDHHTHAAWLEHVHQCVRHLVGESLLYLQPAGKHLDHARDLREADQAAVRQVRDVRPSEERQQVVLAQRVDLDVAHAHQVLVPLAVQRVADHVRDRHVVAAGEPLERCLDSGRRLPQALATRILAQLVEHLAHEMLERRARAGRGHRRQRLGVLVVEAVQAGGLHLVASHAC